MRTKVVLFVATILMLVIGVAAIASNMGFKIAISLQPGVSNFVSIPYYNSYTDAYSLAIDIKGSDSILVTVNRWNKSTGVVESWNSNNRGTKNFTIIPGEAYWVSISAAKSSPWIVVGSHNPSLAITVTSGVSNFVSIPYHTTASNAYQLAVEIKGTSGALVTVNRWNSSTGVVESWNSNNRGTANFSITPGEGLWVASSASISWVPAHY